MSYSHILDFYLWAFLNDKEQLLKNGLNEFKEFTLFTIFITSLVKFF